MFGGLSMIKNVIKNIAVLTMVVGLFTGCAADASEKVVYEGKPVTVSKVEELKRPVELKYKGTVVPKSQVKYAFKSGGKLKGLNVEAGSSVKKGDVLATLDSIDLEIQLNKANSALKASNGDVIKAKEAYEYDKKQYNNLSELFDSGSISKDQLDQMKLKLEVSTSTYKQAKEAYEISQSNYSLQKRLVDDAVIVAKSDGVVLSTQYEEGELVPQGYPVVVMRTNSKVIQVGLSQDDIDRVTMDSTVRIEYGENGISGKIVELNDVPDMATRTYLTKIESSDSDIRIGKILDVSINVGEETGIWVPIDSILSKGEQFVYVVDNDRAFKKIVTIEDLSSFEAKVEGLAKGEQVVTMGMKKLNDGAKVQVVEDKTEVK
jgi:RND family efflux transporter MFP subunit